jgi:hypothetical protein
VSTARAPMRAIYLAGSIPARSTKTPMSRSSARWVRIKRASEYYQVSRNLIRALIAHEQLEAGRTGSSRAIRIDRESLLQLGQFKSWTTR